MMSYSFISFLVLNFVHAVGFSFNRLQLRWRFPQGSKRGFTQGNIISCLFVLFHLSERSRFYVGSEWIFLALKQNLVCGKNVLIDMSIHTAYVKAIRAAQHFIYIENQYFLGSSFNWSNYKDLGEKLKSIQLHGLHWYLLNLAIIWKPSLWFELPR